MDDVQWSALSMLIISLSATYLQAFVIPETNASVTILTALWLLTTWRVGKVVAEGYQQ